MQAAISNSSPIIILAKTNNLHLFKNIFDRIIIPQTVYDEIVIKNDISSIRLKNADYFIITKAPDNQILKSLQTILDKGEAEAIALSIELGFVLIIDEKKGRNVAKNYKLKIIGFLGILYLNYQKKYISKEEILQILEQASNFGYRLSDRLKNDFLFSLSEF
jgi:uncharacterized protein